MHAHASVENLLSRLAWVARLRWVAALGLAVLGLLVRYVFGVGLFLKGLLALAAFVALYNILFIYLHRMLSLLVTKRISFARLERVANIEIALDLVVLTLALHCAGGVENPFLMFYLFHVIIASILLTPRSSYLQATLALTLFSCMALGEYFWPEWHRPLENYLPMSMHRVRLVVTGEITALGVTLYIAAYLATTIAVRLHMQEKQLVETRDSLRQRSQELAEANARLKELEEKKSHFLNLAAHQLRGPLAAVSGCLEGIMGGYAASPEAVRELLSRAHSRVQTMGLLVRDMLTLAKARESSFAAERSRLFFDELVRRAIEQHSQAAREKQIELSFVSGSPGAAVFAHEAGLMDVLTNIISNAVKYTPPGGSVKITTRIHENSLHCKVTDTGIGIPPEEMPKLFSEFFRASNAKKSGIEGTGLGLSIVREIVTEHGGEVQVESLLGLGTCVKISLPLAPAV